MNLVRDENGALAVSKEDNEKKLYEANETIDLLNTKLNQLMISKFCQILSDYEADLMREALDKMSR